MAFCRECGHPDSEVGPLSTRGKCEGCATQIQIDAIYEMRERRGETFRKWRHNHAKAVTPPNRYAELESLLEDG